MDQLRQPVPPNPSVQKRLFPTPLQIIFGESSKSHEILAAVVHLLRSQYETNATLTFERLWKAFNRLYALLGQKGTEFQNQVHCDAVDQRDDRLQTSTVGQRGVLE